MTTRFQSLFADPYGAPTLIRRLLADHALRHRKLYIAAFLMMGVAAACTALSAYLLGDVVNQAYVHKNFQALLIVGCAAFGLFALKGAATYGQQVIMMRIGNRIVADNQRRMFDKLLTENIGFFSDRHSSEFIARLTTGATATNLVLSLLITSIGRDVLTLIGLFAVMLIQDPVMSLVGLIIAPPAMLCMRKLVRARARDHQGAVHRRHADDRDLAGDACRACGSSRRSRWKTKCAAASIPACRRCSTRPTSGRASRTAPAR